MRFAARLGDCTRSTYDGGLSTATSLFRDRLAMLEERLAHALARAGRARDEITLVAVSKKFPAASIAEAWEAGIRHFGENYVQEWAAKRHELPPLAGAQFHLIGHLQTNKARQALAVFDVIQTVDSVRLIEKLGVAADEQRRPVQILFEVKLSEEASKTGAAPAALPDLLAAAAMQPALHVTGLMTVPPWSEAPEEGRPYFRELARLARLHRLPQLSMGMSNDYEVAIEEGATMIRIGTALFGARPKPGVAQTEGQ